MREGIIGGLGIAVIPAFAFTEEISTGKVKILLGKHESNGSP